MGATPLDLHEGGFHLEGLELKMQGVSERNKNLEGMSMKPRAFQDEERFHDDDERSGVVQLFALPQTFATSAVDSN